MAQSASKGLWGARSSLFFQMERFLKWVRSGAPVVVDI